MTIRNLAELRAQTDAQLSVMQGQIAELIKAGGAHMSRPVELSAEAVVALMQNDPARRLIAVAEHRGLGLRIGDTFDPRSRFNSPVQAGQHVAAGLRVAAAPAS